jgi:hypothetical protein
MSEMTLTTNDTSDTTVSTSDESDDTDGGPNLGPCADFIACDMDVTPQVLTTIIATYGEEGTCWKLPGVTEANCWAECEALLAELQKTYPNSEACWECTSDDDCTDATPHCVVGTCTAAEPCDECECSGLCFGTCELVVPAPCGAICQGTCTGTCSETDGEGNCNGMCDGGCEGTCLMPDGGQCPGTCNGMCLFG